MNLELQKSLLMSTPSSAIDGYMLVLLLIMLAAGILGGAVNYYLSEQVEDASSRSWIKYLTLGVFSALTVPLFLNMLSSNLMDAGRTHPISFFIFSGFCLVYVLLSRRFFEAVVAKLLASRKSVGGSPPGQSSEVPTSLRAPDSVDGDAPESLFGTKGDASAQVPNLPNSPLASLPFPQTPPKPENAIESLTLNDISIVRVLSEDSFVCGNISALTEKTGLSRDFISARLTVLKNQGIIETRIDDKNILHWYVSPKNRQTLDDILSSQKES
ncbi:MAG: helix-turn-helix domain-containing protein [Candidatus Accumulibacter sp.]|jgi:DNA-binding transcriptional ArsR family regulator|nr:helix-turn-helix domain-containing protein [Accumulibacter sp.]